MALVIQPIYNVTLSLVDRDRNVSSMTLHVPTSYDIGNIEAAVVTTLIPAVQGISSAIVKSWSVSHSAVDDAAASDAPEESDVERKGVFSFRADDGSAYTVSVPSLKNTVVIDRTNLINTGDALVLAFMAAMITGGVDAPPSTYLGSDLIQLDHARKMHRGSRRG